MKLLTLNFLTCARKACKSTNAAFPLHPKDVELEIVEVELQPEFVRNIMPRVEWEALRGLCGDLGLPSLPPTAPEPSELFTQIPGADSEESTDGEPTQTLKDLHHVLLETTINSGKLVCGNCGHEYQVKEGIANFLLPSHLV